MSQFRPNCPHKVNDNNTRRWDSRKNRWRFGNPVCRYSVVGARCMRRTCPLNLRHVADLRAQASPKGDTK
jgi:hypothetical protein